MDQELPLPKQLQYFMLHRICRAIHRAINVCMRDSTSLCYRHICQCCREKRNSSLPEVDSEDSRNAAKSNHDTPHVVQVVDVCKIIMQFNRWPHVIMLLLRLCTKVQQNTQE